jgi:hypothetical protein
MMKRKTDLGALFALAAQARHRERQNNEILRAFQGSDEERDALERQLDAGVATDRSRVLAARPRTVDDAIAQLALIADRIADDGLAMALSGAIRIAARHAGVDLDAVGGDILLDPEEPADEAA